MKAMNLILVSYITCCVTGATLLGDEPSYRLAYLEEHLKGIQELSTEEQLLYMSYSSIVNADFRYLYQKVIIKKTKLLTMSEGDLPPDDDQFLEEKEDLERITSNLIAEMDRFISYAKLEVRIGTEAYRRMESEDCHYTLREAYYAMYFRELELEELQSMPPEDQYLYLNDRGPVYYSYERLVEEFLVYKGQLEGFADNRTDAEEEKYQHLLTILDQVESALRIETDRILAIYTFEIQNRRKALEKARDFLNADDEPVPIEV